MFTQYVMQMPQILMPQDSFQISCIAWNPLFTGILNIWYNSFFYKKFYTASCSYGLLSMFLYRTGCCIAAQKKAYLYACLSFQNNPVYPYTATKQNTEINEFFKKNNTI